MPFDYSYVLPPWGPAEYPPIREMFDDIRAYVNTLSPSGPAAPADATYVVITLNGTLTNERVITAGSGITITDNGPGSTLVIAATGGVGANQALSNLVAVAVNLSLRPGVTDTIDLGDAASYWRDVYVGREIVFHKVGDLGTVVLLKPSATTTSWTFTLPPVTGSVGQILSTDGSGVTSWVNQTSTSGFATTELDNLTTTGINATLRVGTGLSNTLDLGAVGRTWRDIYLERTVYFLETGGGGDAVKVQAPANIGATYTLTLPPDTGTSGYVLQTDGTGITTWVPTGAGAFATVTLNNLTTTAINASLIPATTQTIDLGTLAKAWNIVYIDGTLTLVDPGVGTNHINIQAPSGLGASYTLTMPGDDGTANQFLQTDGSGVLTWASTTGATTALDNLAAVAINTSLLPATDNAIDLGSATKEFRTAFLKTSLKFQETGVGTDTITIQAPASIVAGYTLTLPVDDGTTDQFLQTNGSGILTWAGATKTDLSNLSAVNINASLGVDTTNAYDLGAAGLTFRRAYIGTSLNFEETGAGTDLISIIAPASIAAPYTLTLPVDDGTTGQVLSTDGSGVLSWVNTAGGSGTVNSGTQYQIGYYATTGTAISGNTGIVTDVDNNLSITNASAATRLAIINTASPGSDAALWLQATSGTTGNAYIRFQINSTPVYWAAGVNNGVSDQFEIAASSNPGTNARLVITTGGQVRLNNGLVGTPSLVFDTSDTDTGIYYSTADSFSLTCGGADSLKVASNYVYPYHPVAAVIDGTVTDPMFTFNNDADCGLYRIGTNDLGITVNGTKTLEISATAPFVHVGVDGNTTNVSVRLNGPSTTGASIATMTNSPVAGNPAAWITININGTNRQIPCW